MGLFHSKHRKNYNSLLCQYINLNAYGASVLLFLALSTYTLLADSDSPKTNRLSFLVSAAELGN